MQKKNKRIPRNVRVKPNGDWEIRVTYSDAGGKRRTMSELCDKYISAKTAAACAERLRAKISERQNPPAVPSVARLTVAEFFGAWLKHIAARVAPRTLEAHTYMVGKAPEEWSRIFLDEFTDAHLSDFYDALLESKKTWAIVYSHKTFKVAFKYAAAKKLIAANPCDGVSIPKLPKNYEPNAMTETEARAFLREARKHAQIGLIFEFALETGMRPEEYLALRWTDVDLTRRLAFVRRAVVFAGSGGFEFGDPKTAASRRSIEMSAPLAEKLAQHRAAQTKMIERRGEKGRRWDNLDLIFSTRYGTPLSRHNLARREFKDILQKAGLPARFSPYSLRHTMATLLLAAGINVKIVSERLGHSDVTITLNTYCHALPTMQAGATAQLASLLYQTEDDEKQKASE